VEGQGEGAVSVYLLSIECVIVLLSVSKGVKDLPVSLNCSFDVYLALEGVINNEYEIKMRVVVFASLDKIVLLRPLVKLLHGYNGSGSDSVYHVHLNVCT